MIMATSIGESRMRLGVRNLASGSGYSGCRSSLVDSSSLTNSEDPLKILTPGKKKLATMESHRVLAIMDEAIKKLDYALLIPHLASHISRFAVSIGENLIRLLKEYNSIVDEYNCLLENLGLDTLPSMGSVTSSLEGNIRPDIDVVSFPGSSCITSSSTSIQLPLQLEPLDKKQTLESQFEKVRFKLKMNVMCILRELKTNPLSSAMSSVDTLGNTSLLQDEVR